jgi:hypothetical protein
MKHQVLAGAGLAAVMAFCGYMIAQLDSRQPGQDQPAAPAVDFGLSR